MSPEYGETSGEFVTEQITRYFILAKSELSQFYFDNDGERMAFSDKVSLSLETEHQKGAFIPTFTPTKEDLIVKIEPESLLGMSESLVEGTDVSSADVTKLLVGVGVARAMLFYKLPSASFEDDPKLFERLEAMFHDDTYLLEKAHLADPVGEARLVETIDRLSYDAKLAVNTLRFCVGISLRHVTDSLPLQHSIARVFYPLLEGDQRRREIDFKMARVLAESEEAAINYYDSTVNYQLLALSFPMTPKEIMNLGDSS